jgi:23S rRNA (pseudouridine1915-N3)-methyltransferase
MNIRIVAIGKKHDPKLISAIEDYTKRLRHYAKCEWKLIEAKITNAMSEDEIKNTESSVLSAVISDEAAVILLDERGTQLGSVEFASKIQNYMNSSVKHVVFIIGGAYGVNEDLMKRADFTLSLSKLVLPHQLVRLILAEQLYRAHTILAGEKYHHQ